MDEQRNCGGCGKPAEPADIDYGGGNIDLGAYWKCVNKYCPFFDSEIPNRY